MKKVGLAVSATTLASLGFYRGTQEYGHMINRKNERAWGKYDVKEIYMYSDAIMQGCVGTFLYINPITLPMALYKELYRAEIYFRDIEVKTNDDYYYKLI